MENLYKECLMELLFSYFLSIRILLLVSLLSCFAMEELLEGSISVYNQLIKYHLFYFAKTPYE
jgi:hypothetical protein